MSDILELRLDYDYPEGEFANRSSANPRIAKMRQAFEGVYKGAVWGKYKGKAFSGSFICNFCI